MRAVVFGDVRERPRRATSPTPRIEEPADAIVRVTRTAICGSDLHFFHGKAPIEPGDVARARGRRRRRGRRARASNAFSPGDRVVVAFNIACGECWFCRPGQTSLCDDFRNLGAGMFGGSLAGAQAELVRIPIADVNLLQIPDGMDDERALFVGDILTTGVYGAAIAGIEPGEHGRRHRVRSGRLLRVQAARAFGAAAVLVVDMRARPARPRGERRREPVNAEERHPQRARRAHGRPRAPTS